MFLVLLDWAYSICPRSELHLSLPLWLTNASVTNLIVIKLPQYKNVLKMLLVVYLLYRAIIKWSVSSRAISSEFSFSSSISNWSSILNSNRYTRPEPITLCARNMLAVVALLKYTSKVDLMNRLRGLSLRLRQQGFQTNLLQRSFTKFFNRHGLIVVKYGATLREMRSAIQAWIAPSYPYITYLFIT